jgi:ParB family chromosome partitioning protein
MTEAKQRLDEVRPRGLGRGLSALIGEEALPSRGEISMRKPLTLPVAFLTPNRLQPRVNFSEEEIRELADSLHEKGMLQPILVRPITGESQRYEIIAGERRWRAAQLARLHEVPVVIREVSDAESLELAIIENVQRSDLNAIEEARAYHELMDRFAYTQEQVAKVVGKSRSHVANTIRLLKLPEGVKSLVRDGQLSAGHARALLGTDNPEARAREIILGALNVRQTEHRSSNGKSHRSSGSAADPNIAELESSLYKLLGLRMKVMHKQRGGGELRISYRNLEQLDGLIHKLKDCV